MRPAVAECDWDDLVRRTGWGESEAFEQLYRLSRSWLLKIVRQAVRTPEDAEEVLMDSYLQIWRSAGRFDPSRGNAKTWLCLIARSRAFDRLRASRHSFWDELPAEPTDPSAGPEERAVRSGLRQSIGHLVASLPGPDAELIRLTYFLGHTQAEIAEMQRSPLGTVKSRMRSVHIRLRGRLRAEARGCARS